MPNNNQVLLNFIKNINQHFSDKSSAYHLTYGRDLIKTDIQDLIDIYTPVKIFCPYIYTFLSF